MSISATNSRIHYINNTDENVRLNKKRKLSNKVNDLLNTFPSYCNLQTQLQKSNHFLQSRPTRKRPSDSLPSLQNSSPTKKVKLISQGDLPPHLCNLHQQLEQSRANIVTNGGKIKSRKHLKRSLESSDNPSPRKKQKLRPKKLVDLYDDALTHIASFLSQDALLDLSEVSSRLNTISKKSIQFDIYKISREILLGDIPSIHQFHLKDAIKESQNIKNPHERFSHITECFIHYFESYCLPLPSFKSARAESILATLHSSPTIWKAQIASTHILRDAIPLLQDTWDPILAKAIPDYEKIQDLEQKTREWVDANPDDALSIEEVHLQGRGMTYLPGFIDRLRYIKRLYLRDNELRDLPPLPENVEILDVGNNRFSTFPLFILEAIHLKYLYFDNNPTKHLPNLIKTNLEFISLESTPISDEELYEIPSHISVQTDSDSDLDYSDSDT